MLHRMNTIIALEIQLVNAYELVKDELKVNKQDPKKPT